jgi:hypothetical protein
VIGVGIAVLSALNPGLPDFSWYNIPKPEKIPNELKLY